ncbi:methyltransferase [Leucobacter sp. NPDC077196]|uniref:class I SAM-dependent methyltransferase n=1 Tax=Leucobacter sp. NPDC077196 TaxID=3154959 RepID=UPI00342D0E60
MTEPVRFYDRKDETAIIREWDSIAPIRDRQVASHQDASYERVLEPWILGRVDRSTAHSIVDVGCGTGRLTSKLRLRADETVGIDPSAVSIRLARAHDDATRFDIATAEDWVRCDSEARFDLAVANMVLMDALDLDGIVGALATLARGGGVLATIAHPAFWPIYWDYAGSDGFSYLDETVVETPFRTSSKSYGLVATHVHRPIETYLSSFNRHGLVVTAFEELRGPESIEKFPYPRFIGIEASVLP